MATVEEEVVTMDHLPTSVYQTPPQPLAGLDDSLDAAVENLERGMILKAQKKFGSTRSVAKALGISQSRASRLIRKYKK